MRVLFWVGYRFEEWNSQSDGLGGTEIAVSKVAESLAQHGNEVIVAGEVISGVHNRVTWLSIQDFENSNFRGRDPNRFDAVIGVNYLHFIRVIDDNGLKPKLTAFWLHNTEWHQYYKGEVLENQMDLLNRIDTVITPSAWANRKFRETYCQGISLDTLSWTRPIQSQVNGIDPLKFKMNCAKDPNKLIWSSAVDRGLNKLLDNWWRVKEVMPEATLDIYYPKYSDPHVQDDRNWYNIDGILDKLEENKDLGVTDMGSVSQLELHTAMQKATYWMYLTHYEETFCITAIEMMAAGVLPICTNVAALKEVVDSGIILDKAPYETLFKDAIKLLKQLDTGLKDKAIESGKKTTKLRTWNAVASKWYELITTYKKPA